VLAAAASLLLAAAQPAVPVTAPIPCRAETASVMTVDEVAATPHLFMGRCITVSGMGGRARIFGGVEAYYRQGRGGAEEERSHLGLVGLRSRGGLPGEEPVALTVTGILSSCRELRELVGTRRPGLSLPPYCLFGLAPVIVVMDHRIDPSRRYERLVGDENRRTHGTLALAADDWVARTGLREAAEEFRRAVAAGDVAALRRLHAHEGDPAADPELIPYFLDQPDSPFAELRAGGPRQLAVLLHTGRMREQLVASGRDEDSFLCFCRTADCSGLWPISAADAENRADRPYVCTYHTTQGHARFRTSVAHGFLPEPAASAFRRPPDSSDR
jgi:hypothetical protein